METTYVQGQEVEVAASLATFAVRRCFLAFSLHEGLGSKSDMRGLV